MAPFTVSITAKLQVHGTTKARLLGSSMWQELMDELDAKIDDTYYLIDDDKDAEVEVEIGVVEIMESAKHEI